MTHDEGHLIREAIRRFGQALATSCLADTKIKERATAEDLKAQQTFKLRKEVENMQSELQHTKNFQQEDERLMAEKTKEAANQAQEATAERGRLLVEVEKLKGELARKR